jgi:hypothetical protein
MSKNIATIQKIDIVIYCYAKAGKHLSLLLHDNNRDSRLVTMHSCNIHVSTIIRVFCVVRTAAIYRDSQNNRNSLLVREEVA